MSEEQTTTAEERHAQQAGQTTEQQGVDAWRKQMQDEPPRLSPRRFWVCQARANAGTDRWPPRPMYLEEARAYVRSTGWMWDPSVRLFILDDATGEEVPLEPDPG